MFGHKDVLTVCLPAISQQGMAAASGREAMELMRMLRFDLVLVSRNLPDMTAWQLIGRVKTAWSWQKWGLVGPSISNDDEITARMLGVITIFDEMPQPPVLEELLARASESSRRSIPIAAGM